MKRIARIMVEVSEQMVEKGEEIGLPYQEQDLADVLKDQLRGVPWYNQGSDYSFEFIEFELGEVI